jgi:RNA polymerase sigma-70 factor (ECF subfamily)
MDVPAGGRLDLEHYRPYLHLLVRLDVDPHLQGKIDLSGIVQQTLWEVHRDVQQLHGKTQADLLAWLRRALANNLTDEIRKLGAQVRDVSRERSLQQAMEESSSRLQAWLAADMASPSQHLIREEQLLRVAEVLEQLPADQRRAVELHHLQRQSLAAVAADMGRSKGAVAQLVFRGLRKLRRLLGDDDSE